MWRKVGKRAPGWTKALSVRHEYATSGPARRRGAAAARSARARQILTGYREADALANLAVRGLQMAPGELKAVTVYIGDSAATWSGSVHLLNGIARGDDITERNGRQVTMKSIEVQLQFQCTTPVGVPGNNMIRVMIVYDRQANAAALTPAQVLDSIGTINTPITPKNLENRERFVILRDMKFGIPGSQVADFIAAPKYAKFYQGVSMPVTFNAGDAGTVADIVTGSLYLLVFSDEAAGASNPRYHGTSRVRYADS